MTELRELWAGDRVALGAWVMLREPLIALAASNAGYDYVCLDLQHGAIGHDDLLGMLQVMPIVGATPLVRVPWNEPWLIGRALDAGALGVIVPMVNTAAEAARAATACRYAPRGSRSIGPIAASARYGADYATWADERVLCIVMIETAEAVANLDEILAVPGIDAVYVGPSDLSLTLGLPPAADHTDPRFVDALSTIVAACRRHGVVPGVHASSSLAAGREAAGFRMITVGFDQGPIVAALKSDLQRSRSR
jgi:4-hydroxy-2-oxoheptanedioate aldolase